MRYDLRQGLQRRNYLIATLLFSMRLFAVYRSVQFYCNVESISSRGSIGDYMLCLFRGMAIISQAKYKVQLAMHHIHLDSHHFPRDVRRKTC